jgi:hypothetical protein
VDAAAAETHVRLLAEGELRRAVTSPGCLWVDRDFADGGPPPSEEGLLRMQAVLSALVQVEAITGAVASVVLSEFAGALAARGRCPPQALLNVPGTAGPGGGGPVWSPGGPAAPAPGGKYRAIPVGAVVPAERDGHRVEAHLQSLVLAPDRAAIVTTFVSTGRAVVRRSGGTAARQPSFPPFGGSGLRDDQGRSYRLSFEAGEGGWHESGVLSISPLPPDAVRWLTLPITSVTSVRISLAGAVPGARVISEPAAPGAMGDQLLTAVAETMLGGGPMAGVEATHLASSLAEVAEALEVVDALPRNSVTAGHLAALCQRRGIQVRGYLAAQARAVGLPGRWTSVLNRSQDQDGPPGVLPVAAVLPEIDGARFVLAGLTSWERHAALPVFAWGWSPRHRGFHPGQPFSWWARDDAGRWHVGRPTAFNAIPGTFQLELTPPLDPGATSLDIIVTGRSSRVTVTLPLR